MKNDKKSRCDAKLKTLPEERQAAIVEYALTHSGPDTVKWLRGDGLQTSTGALSVFLSWYRLQRRLAVNESTVSSLLEDLKRNDPTYTAEQLELAGQAFFSKLAIEQEDSLTWKRVQDGKAKLELVRLMSQKFRRETPELFIKWFEDKRAKEVLTSTASNTDKIEKLGELMFGEDLAQVTRVRTKAAEEITPAVLPKSPMMIRAGQREFELGVQLHRISGLLARRQWGKTTVASRIALKKMMKTPGHTVIFGSVKLDLGREIVRKESAEIQKAFLMLSQMATKAKARLDVVEDGSDKSIALVDADAWAGIYEAQRLEFRLYHSNSVYSRTKVVALTPDAVGETGDLIMDEIGRAKRFREVLEAVMPIIASNPNFRAIYTTTPPPDDSHPSFELLAPPMGTDLPVNPKGNWYRSDMGVWVLRVTAYDAYADNTPLYDDDTGAAISPDESRRRANDKDAWDRNYGCKFVIGGTSACGLLQLDSAQRRGQGKCALYRIDSDSDLDAALRLLVSQLSNGPVGLGWDLATTTKETSNPSAFGVIEQRGVEYTLHLFTWKTADPDVAMERARKIVMAVKARRDGGPPRRLCVDATNERYFSQLVRKELAALVPVELVIGSETIELPGREEKITMKQYLGGQLVAELDDNHLTLPPERYLREDWRLVKKEKGQFVCEPDVDGRHGDTFDGAKLALRSLRSTGGAITAETIKHIHLGHTSSRMPVFIPRRLA